MKDGRTHILIWAETTYKISKKYVPINVYEKIGAQINEK